MYIRVTKNHYYVVDLIRFISALLVMLFHFGSFTNERTGAWVFPLLSAFRSVGAIGVEIFFVISGLVIAMSAERLRGLQGALKFLHLRALRILPALWISSLIAFSVLLLAGGDLPTLVRSLVKTATLSPVGPYVDGVVWSLVVEAVFYLTVGVTIIAAPRVSLEALAKIIGLISALYLVVWTIAFLANEHLYELLSRFPSKVFLLRYGVFFALGMLLWARVAGRRSSSITAATVLSGIMCVLEIFTARNLAFGAGAAAAAIWVAAVGLMVFSIIYANAIEQGLNEHERKTLRYLGALSYALYLNHYTFGSFVVQSLLSATRLPTSLVFIISVCAVLMMAALVTTAERMTRRPQRIRTAAHT